MIDKLSFLAVTAALLAGCAAPKGSAIAKDQADCRQLAEQYPRNQEEIPMEIYQACIDMKAEEKRTPLESSLIDTTVELLSAIFD